MSRRKFAKPSEEIILNKCPFCGGELEYSELYQYMKAYRILKNGKISKVVKYKEDNGPMECGLISCSNPDCDFLTDCNFDVDITGPYNHIYIRQNDKGQFLLNVN